MIAPAALEWRKAPYKLTKVIHDVETAKDRQMDLDDLNTMAQLDSGQMVARIRELPDQCRAAWNQAQSLNLPDSLGDVDNIVIVGMGGSAIGGALLQDLTAGQCPVPVTVVRGYSLPAFVGGARTLVIACSYSGNTEETLSCVRHAVERESQVLAITTGGRLAELAREGTPKLVRFSYQSQPRAALGYSFVLLVGALHRLALIPDYSAQVTEAAAVMEAWQGEIQIRVPTSENAAKQLAQKVHGGLPVVYGAGFLTATANRWKTQFNENAKNWAAYETLPELNHNAVVGLGIPEVAREHILVVALRSALDSVRIAERWDVTAQLLDREGVSAEQVWGRGEGKLAQILSLIHFGDYVSYYTAMLNQVDPTPVETIAFLKDRLAQLGSIAE